MCEKEEGRGREFNWDKIQMSMATKAYKSQSFLLQFMLFSDHIPIVVNVPDIPGLDPPDGLVCRYTVTRLW